MSEFRKTGLIFLLAALFLLFMIDLLYAIFTMNFFVAAMAIIIAFFYVSFTYKALIN